MGKHDSVGSKNINYAHYDGFDCLPNYYNIVIYGGMSMCECVGVVSNTTIPQIVVVMFYHFPVPCCITFKRLFVEH